jgi:deoxyribodipyrimidine photo-lyase
MKAAIVLFGRDLRVHDHPALRAGLDRADTVVPLFVFDEAILGSSFAAPNRMSFLLDSLTDLRVSLHRRGGDLFIRRGSVVAEAMGIAREVGAEAILCSADFSAHALTRQELLGKACAEEGIEFETFEGVAALAPKAVLPAGGDHYKVFTPYSRAWAQADKREVIGAPRRVSVPSGVAGGRLPKLAALVNGDSSPSLIPGGETEARRRLTRWLSTKLERYEARHDDLAADDTSRMSAYLHFGCISPLEVVARATGRSGAEPFVRQIVWSDFFLQVLAASPSYPRSDYRSRGIRWRNDPDGLRAWKEGLTGFPIVDAGMRQLRAEGFMHNRARLITAAFLVKFLRIDWRLGAAHFWELLVDGDIANNAGNWQWVAGTGNDTRPNRGFNPLRQAKRFDPKGEYVRRWVPELSTVAGSAALEPWKLDDATRSQIDYPDPIVDPP